MFFTCNMDTFDYMLSFENFLKFLFLFFVFKQNAISCDQFPKTTLHRLCQGNVLNREIGCRRLCYMVYNQLVHPAGTLKLGRPALYRPGSSSHSSKTFAPILFTAFLNQNLSERWLLAYHPGRPPTSVTWKDVGSLELLISACT